MPANNKTEYSEGLLPDDFLTFIKFSAVLGFIAALVFVSALVYKGVEKLVGLEEAKKYRWVVVVVDVVVLFIFGFMYIVLF
jgi:hypothetical protein